MDGGVEGKLGDHLVPLHYSLHLSPCLTTFTFTGQVTIDLELRQPTNCLLVNAKQLKVETVTLIREEVEVEEEAPEGHEVDVELPVGGHVGNQDDADQHGRVGVAQHEPLVQVPGQYTFLGGNEPGLPRLD